MMIVMLVVMITVVITKCSRVCEGRSSNELIHRHNIDPRGPSGGAKLRCRSIEFDDDDDDEDDDDGGGGEGDEHEDNGPS